MLISRIFDQKKRKKEKGQKRKMGGRRTLTLGGTIDFEKKLGEILQSKIYVQKNNTLCNFTS